MKATTAQKPQKPVPAGLKVERDAANDALNRQTSSTTLRNYITNENDAPPIMERLAQMALVAKTKGQLLLVSEIRYAIAGIPDQITDEYIHWPAGAAIEVGSTGKLGDKPEEFERNPGEKLVAAQSFCFAEFIKDPG